MSESATETTTDAERTIGIATEFEVRAIDADKRTAEFVAATENGVETYFGTEYLRMRGADLKRYRRNPVVLDSHNRFEAEAVIGRATVKVVSNQLIASIEFAETARAEGAWQLVQGGYLKAVSIGFIARDVETLAEGETGRLGKRKIEGPARLVREWELYEISVVPVPGDHEALRRSLIEGSNAELTREVRCLVGAVHRLISPEEEREMPKDKKPKSVPATEEADEKDLEAQATEPMESRVAAQPTATGLIAQQIREICPDGLRDVGDRCILEGLSFEDARKRLLAEHEKRAKPVGTTDTSALDTGADRKKDEQQGAELTLDKMDDKALLRSLCG